MVKSWLRVFLAVAIVALGLLATRMMEGNSWKYEKLSTKPILFPVPSDSEDHLVWFIHVTDIHISDIPGKRERFERFEHFVGDTIPQINPSFVVVTGDLCHGKYGDQTQNSQSLTEWMMYRTTLEKHGRFDPNFWIDLRGNHDCFNTGLKSSTDNPFFQFSVTGHFFQNPVRSFTHSLGEESSYSIITLDGCPPVGAFSPLNFFGKLNKTDLDLLDRTLHEHKQHNHTIVIGHYPLSVISSERNSNGHNLMQILDQHQTTLYLCGHLHTAFGPKLQARHSKTLVELELGDFKVNNMFRLIAIDHDIISFVDVQQDSWPLLLITNPKDATYLSHKEPFERAAFSSHIRFLAFSDVDIVHVHVEIDDVVIHNAKVAPQDSPLFALPWTPILYPAGLHTLKVTVTDKQGKVALQEHDFSIDGTMKPFENYSRWILLGPIQEILIWGFIAIDIVVVLFLFGIYHCTPESGAKIGGARGFLVSRCFTLRRYSLVYFTLLFLWSTMMLLPWFIGVIATPDHIGAVFVWGIVHFYESAPQQFVVDYFHTMDTHLYTSFQLFNYALSLAFFLLFLGREQKCFMESKRRFSRAIIVFFMYGLALYQIRNSFMIMRKIGMIYGWYSLLISPFIGWYNTFIILYVLQFLLRAILNAISTEYKTTKKE